MNYIHKRQVRPFCSSETKKKKKRGWAGLYSLKLGRRRDLQFRRRKKREKKERERRENGLRTFYRNVFNFF